jgi:RimJ/RimL family protein N-acetyltransferase
VPWCTAALDLLVRQVSDFESIDRTWMITLQSGAPRVLLRSAAPNAAAQALFERMGFRKTMVELTREFSY